MKKPQLPKTAPKKTGKRGIGPKPEPAQAELLKVPEQEKPPSVQNDRILAHYVKPHFQKKKAGERTISLELSFFLTDEHEEHIPKQIREDWKFMQRRGKKRLDIVDVPGQIVKFWLTSDDKEEALVLPAAKVTHVSLQVVEAKGTGQKQKMIRLSFRLEVKMTADVGRFAEWNYGEALWIVMHETQESLFDEEED